MTIYFNQTTGMDGSTFVEFPLRPSAVLKNQNDDKCCFLRSILASLRPCNISYPERVSNYSHYFKEKNVN